MALPNEPFENRYRNYVLFNQEKKKIFLQQGSSSSAGILQLNLNGK